MNSVLIIGSGPAGMAAAIRARQQNLDVTVIEIEDENYEKTCGDGLTERAIHALRCIEIFPEDLTKAGANEIRTSLRVYPNRRHIMSHEERSYYTLRRISLIRLMRKRAISMGVKIHYRTPYRPDMKADILVDASGCRAKKAYNGMNYPMGISAVIHSVAHLRNDTLYFAYPDEEGCRYGWAFPLSGDMWNVGVWEPENPKRLQTSFATFKTQYLDHYFRDAVIVKPLRGAPLGTIRPVTVIGTHVLSCGDAAGLCDPYSGEGVSYALQSGIDVAEAIMTK